MREKQLAQEAKKLDAKVGGTKSRGLEETGQRIRTGWSKWRGDGELEPTDHPEAGVPRDGERGFGRGFPGKDGGWAVIHNPGHLWTASWGRNRPCGRLIMTPFPSTARP